ncbi:MAG: glutamate-5-semialdehyde dehydrogenase [Acutalibacteraceae bacterium]
MTTSEIMELAKAASSGIANASSEQKNNALLCMAEALEKSKNEIISANAADMNAARGKISDVMLDRLELNEKRISDMASGIRSVAKLPDPVGRILSSYRRPDGLSINKVSVPLGVVAIIYESRPNVTSDAAALVIKSGNACILRCGKEAHNSAAAITKALKYGLSKADISPDVLFLVEDASRESANELMRGKGFIDLLIPRGGKGLISACVQNATVPCIETGTGICHVYVDADANLDMALDIIENAKTSRPSVCNAEEVCLIHEDIVERFVPMLENRLVTKRIEKGLTPVTLKADGTCFDCSRLCERAGENDFDTEFLDYILALGAVKNVKDAVAHILKHSTGHSEAIITNNSAAADYFVKNTDSAAVYVNASTRFTDGGEFGLGCEMGISTQKLHARGPMGLCELNTYKYVINGNGNIR